MKAALQLLQQLAQRRVRARRALQRLARPGHHGGRAYVLAHSIDFHLAKRGYRLAGGGHDAADLVQLVTEEVEAHRVWQVAGEHVYDATFHGERAGALEVARVLVAALLEDAKHVVELRHAQPLGSGHISKFAPRAEHERLVKPRLRGRQLAQQRAGRRDHHGIAARGQHVCRLQPTRYLARVGRLQGEGRVAALREVQHAVVAQIGAQVARERGSGVFPGHHHERRLRRVREARGHHEGTRRGGDAQRGVLSPVELAPEGLERLRALERICQRID